MNPQLPNPAFGYPTPSRGPFKEEVSGEEERASLKAQNLARPPSGSLPGSLQLAIAGCPLKITNGSYPWK